MFADNLTYLNLHLVHWLLAVLLPLSTVIAALVILLALHRARHRLARDIGPVKEKIDALSGRSIANLPTVDDIFQTSRSLAVRHAFNRLLQDSRDLYQSGWLPDPAREFNRESLLSPAQRRRFSWLPAATLLAAGLAGSAGELLAQHWFLPPDNLAAALAVLPGLTALAAALLVAAWTQYCARRLQTILVSLQASLVRRLPVFSDQAGIALLIDDFHAYDRDMKETLRQFTATAGRLAESDMADGIRRSVEQVLLDSVAPSIRQASSALAGLASELANRQERGMQDLAVRFATALAAEIAGNLQPVSREISQMSSLMADVRNYIEYAMRALETVRQQSESLLGDTRESLRGMSDARSQLTADFSQADSYLRQLAASTGELANLYQGNAQGLNQNLQRLSDTIGQYGENLGSIILEAAQSVQEIRLAADAQQDTTGQYLAAMEEQIGRLTGQLNSEIGGLLDAMRAEASAIASHTGEIGNRLGDLNGALESSIGEFTQASAQYVRQTLTSFDGNLADLASRIAATAAELRDAVDALPQALRQAAHTGAGGTADAPKPV